jgi:hypothetical protein
VRGSSDKIVVRSQQCQFVPNAELCKQSVDGANLDARTTTPIAQFCGVNVILPVRGKERERCESIDNVFTRTRASEPLQQFLQNQSRGHNGFATFEGAAQRPYFGAIGRRVATEGERPDAGIDEQRHRRERSAL